MAHVSKRIGTGQILLSTTLKLEEVFTTTILKYLACNVAIDSY